MQSKDYYNKGYHLAGSSKYGRGIGGKIRAYEENIGKVANASPEWEQFLCGWDNYINDVCLKAKQEGYDAGYKDDGIQCPYPEDSEEEFYWLSGYCEALDNYSRGFDL